MYFLFSLDCILLSSSNYPGAGGYETAWEAKELPFAPGPLLCPGFVSFFIIWSGYHCWRSWGSIGLYRNIVMFISRHLRLIANCLCGNKQTILLNTRCVSRGGRWAGKLSSLHPRHIPSWQQNAYISGQGEIKVYKYPSVKLYYVWKKSFSWRYSS